MQTLFCSVPVRTVFVPAAVALAVWWPGVAAAFDSGSTGADGVLSPTVNTEVVLPPSGVLNYTSINIPSGVTVTFKKNVTNTPVVLLVSGAATIAGTINVNGTSSTPTGAGGDGVVGDDGLAGVGGPGGYVGGRGGLPGSTIAATSAGPGQGPGAGTIGGVLSNVITRPFGGGGAGYGVAGSPGFNNGGSGTNGGVVYGSATLLPLLGGSGGAGGAGGPNYLGAGGGGGGGALLIAATGTLTVNGAIVANAGTSGVPSGAGCGAPGGGGSGGAIRLVSTTLAGNGTISAQGGAQVSAGCSNDSTGWVATGGAGGAGRIRLEAEVITRTAASTPAHTFSAPGPIFISGLPTLAITSVAGVAVPGAPTGVADVSLPSTTTNPVAVTFQTTGVPVGNTVSLKVTPAFGTATSAVSTALAGSTASATAGVSVTLPTGASSLQASVTYTIVVAMGEALARYAGNERVEKIMLSATPGSASKAALITVSGKQYEAPPEAMQIAAFGT